MSVLKNIDEIYKFFSNMYFDSRKDGSLNRFICDFIQDEFGIFHFIKISAFSSDGKPVQSEDWVMSVKLKEEDNIKKLARAGKNVCNANIICMRQLPMKLVKKQSLSWANSID